MKVSVVIPTHNRAAYLREAVMSALEQTWRDLEVVIVDDGSTDYTAEVVRGIQDPRVHYLRQENRGVASALNTGWRAARGEYIARLDSDDAWLPTLLANLVPHLEKDPRLGVTYGKAQWMDHRGRPLPQILGAPLKFPRQVLASLLYGDSVCPIAVVLRRSALERVGGYDESLIGNEDWDLWLRLALYYPFLFHNAILARYRSHPGNLTASGSSRFRQLIADRIRVLDKFYARPSLPSEALKMKPVAYRNVYQDIAIRHLSIGQWPLAFDYLARAARAAPGGGLFLLRSIGVIVYYLFLSKTGWGVRLVSALGARRGQAR